MAESGLLIPRRTLLLGLAALIFITISGHGPARADADEGRLYFPGFSISEPTGQGWAPAPLFQELEISGENAEMETKISYIKEIAPPFHMALMVVFSGRLDVSGGISDAMRRHTLEILAKRFVAKFGAEFNIGTFEMSPETPFGTDCIRIDSVFEERAEDVVDVASLGNMHGYICINPEKRATFAAIYIEALAEGEEPSSTLEVEGEAFLRSIQIYTGSV